MAASKLELLSPAGDLEKLKVAFSYGADAAYFGLDRFSLRSNATNFRESDLDEIKKLKKKTHKRLYLALNILFHEDQIVDLLSMKEELERWPVDAYIISDLGAVSFLKKNFPERELHLSTQASCLNSESAKLYQELGFKRIILAREASLDDIRRIKDRVPELELEAFAHGAMCMSYSGRCLLSAFMSRRSGNQGDCSHSCRWTYRLGLEEEERPGDWYPIEEYPDHTLILSSKDLNMIDHIKEMKEAGLSSIKIEGRMKSILYVATVTRAYRKAIDEDPSLDIYKRAMESVSHREYTTAFFFPDEMIDSAMTKKAYHSDVKYLGSIIERGEEGIYRVDVRNQIRAGDALYVIDPNLPDARLDSYSLLDGNMTRVSELNHMKEGFLKTNFPLRAGDIIIKASSRDPLETPSQQSVQ